MPSPILLLGYNRADLIEAQLQSLLVELKSSQVFISVDGPKNNSKDRTYVAEVRDVIARFKKRYPKQLHVQTSSKNLGCQKGVEKGIDWFFSKVDQGIILEDDCQPHQDFFPYCDVLLHTFRNDERIGMISGCNPLTKLSLKTDYFYSHQSIIWGWATWKRSWQRYHAFKAKAKNVIADKENTRQLCTLTTQKHLRTLSLILEKKIDTWDYIWYFTNLSEARLSVIPTRNLVRNVGFGNRATHTKIKTTQGTLPIFPVTFPLRQPETMIVNHGFENRYLAQVQPWNLLRSIFSAYLP